MNIYLLIRKAPTKDKLLVDIKDGSKSLIDGPFEVDRDQLVDEICFLDKAPSIGWKHIPLTPNIKDI